jgi:hypothetical protein
MASPSKKMRVSDEGLYELLQENVVIFLRPTVVVTVK